MVRKLRYHARVVRPLQHNWNKFMWRYALFLVLPIAFATLVIADAPRASTTTTLVVAVAPDQPLDAVGARLQSLGYSVRRQIDDIHALDVSGRDDDPSVQRVEAVDGVRYAEQVRAVAEVDTPSDPLFGNESGYLQAVGAQAAWDITTGTPNIVVAVVDTGVAIQHVDLQQNIWVNPGEIANNGADDDGNGCVDDINGCAFVSDSSPGCSNVTNGFVNDDIGHGTFVSGVIAAAANGVGIVGVARHVRIMP